MNRLDAKFKELKGAGRKAFIAYITAGDPNLSMTERLVQTLYEAGVDIIELGIPFSDPLADGPTIQAASQRALVNHVNLANIFKAVSRLRKKTDVPIAFMTYYNPVLKYGLPKFFKSCRACGVDGVIVPDLPEEEAGDLIRYARMAGVSTIFLAAPTSKRGRIMKIVKNSRGFIYYVSLTGVTGARAHLPSDIKKNIQFIKSVTDKPVVVGFGVSGAAQASRLAGIADGVIVGSAIVRIIGAKGDIQKNVSEFASTLAKAIHNA